MKRNLYFLLLLFITVPSLFMLPSCLRLTEETGNDVETSHPDFIQTITSVAQTKEEPDKQTPQPINITQEPTPIRKTIGVDYYKDNEVLLIIEKLNIKVPIKVAEVYENQEVYMFTDSHDYPQWIPEWSKDIGQFGISIIYGHRQWGIELRIFSEIDKLDQGDKLMVVSDDYEFTFIVSESIVITDPSMIWEELGEREADFIRKNQSLIALLTCTPWGTDWNRLVVFGILDEGS